MNGKIQNLNFLEPIFGYLEEVSVNSLNFNSKLEGKTLEFTLKVMSCVYRVWILGVWDNNFPFDNENILWFNLTAKD